MDHSRKLLILTQRLMSFLLIAYVISLFLLYQLFISNRGTIFTLVDRLHLEPLKSAVIEFLSFMTSLLGYNLTFRQLGAFSSVLSLIIIVTSIPYLVLLIINIYKLSLHIEIGLLQKSTPTEKEKNNYLYYENGFVPFVLSPSSRGSVKRQMNSNKNQSNNMGVFREPNEALLDYYNSAIKKPQKSPILIGFALSVLLLPTLGIGIHGRYTYENFGVIAFFVVILFVFTNELLMYFICLYFRNRKTVSINSE
ncbi:hypothetical protein HF669_09600 [Acidithiobacillus thiooxidans]|uniref:hypothetical protein n=1 Tax=Acidithiobacillus TaxID=119977 RepID=UPI0002624C1A|nr:MULTISPECIES: hypothetical protein [Acidithiobacillus]MBU2741806.1 hypothetical protein [Acidithiobacillus albertensis]MBU2811613.1 hypothetical protein [Acidithiobacillus thiooxidans]